MHAEGSPSPGLVEGFSHSSHGIPQAMNPRQTRQQTTFPKHERRMQVADKGRGNPRKAGPHAWQSSEEREARRIMQKEQ